MGWGGGGANQDLLNPAITEAITPIMPLEQEWDAQKLEKRLRGYFRNAAKGLEFGSKPWDMLIDEYADRAWAAIFQALHDREWLQQADFLLVVDAGVKETFPRYVLQGVPQQAFERAVLNSNDRAFEEQRFLPMLWETITQFVEGPKLKKKAYDAFDVGRKRAALNAGAATDAGTPLEAFTEAWIAATVGRLATDNGGDPAALLPQDACTQMFQSLVSQGALPLPLVTEHGSPPEGWPFIDEAVGRAYEQAAALASADPAERRAALAKGGVKGLLSGARTRGNYGLAAAGAGKGAHAGPATAWGRSSDVYGQPLGGGWGGGAGGGCIRPAGGGGGIWGAGAAAGAQWNGGGGCAGAYGGGGGYPAKRQRVGTATYDKPTAAAAGGGGKGKKTKGNPTCTQQEDCIGTPSTPLFQHVDGETPGDIYCASCWAVFADADPSLQAIPYQG